MQSVYSQTKSLFLSHTYILYTHTTHQAAICRLGRGQSSWVTSLSLQLNLACICRGGITLIYCHTVPSPPTTISLTMTFFKKNKE